VYSLAATLYAALCGEPPHGSANLAQLILAHSTRMPPPVAERRPDLPGRIASEIDRALAVAPEERPSATELAEALAVDEKASAASDGRTAFVPDRGPVHPIDPPSLMQPAPAVQAAPTVQVAPAARGRRLPRPFLFGLIAGGAVAVAIAIASSSSSSSGGDRGRPPSSPGGAPPNYSQPAAALQSASEPPAAPPAWTSDVPPWEFELPPELTEWPGGKPSDLVKRWRKTVDKVNQGDWDKASEELREILARDPGNRHAATWLSFLEQAARDPRWNPQLQGGWDEDPHVDE
jgi:serine/threonine protein kinase